MNSNLADERSATRSFPARCGTAVCDDDLAGDMSGLDLIEARTDHGGFIQGRDHHAQHGGKMSERLVARNLNAPHNATIPVAVINSDVFGAAIIPERHRSLAPAETASEFRPGPPIHEVIKQRRTLLFSHAFEADGVRPVAVKTFSACFGMSSDNRVNVLSYL